MSHDVVHGIWRSLRRRLRRVGPLRAARRRVLEMRTYLLAVHPSSHMPSKKFVVFAQGRTGSDLLASLLNSHPKVFCDGEILSARVLLPMTFVKGRCHASTGDTYGYKLKIYDLTETQHVSDPGSFLRQLHAEGWRVIYLTRRNVLRQVLSWLLARRRRKWQQRSSDGPLVLESMTVDCDELLQRMEQRLQYLVEEKEVLATLPHITVVYEDHLLQAERHQRTMDVIFNYLRLPPVPVGTDLLRITPRHAWDFITNYEEVQQAVATAGYGRFLSERV